jgi:hypothetical protein
MIFLVVLARSFFFFFSLLSLIFCWGSNLSYSLSSKRTEKSLHSRGKMSTKVGRVFFSFPE